ncbi:MAG: BlaI/MecI/CopY family transcriptional regulator [Verrucomicrobiae bacterium]|nr:BlaI/MecI/CopY family transcriptional regulator [Verrucomicrobiae bacterium]MCP5539535.1 BlaI/MecI/CopY family transcriptional regulator [Akkermansiaceae bacterium]MCP5550066.1 BlaI/MecI/CopY family transcriptional regulator [Akkermansiaceae bacterium]
MPKSLDIPQISDAEWTVMRVFWERGEATVNDVVAALEGFTDWKPRTIQTLIRRLHQKGALAHEKNGREFLYRPAVDERDCEHAASRSFLTRVFDGRLTPFLATFAERESLSDEEIAELRKILERNTRDS